MKCLSLIQRDTIDNRLPIGIAKDSCAINQPDIGKADMHKDQGREYLEIIHL